MADRRLPYLSKTFAMTCVPVYNLNLQHELLTACPGSKKIQHLLRGS